MVYYVLATLEFCCYYKYLFLFLLFLMFYYILIFTSWFLYLETLLILRIICDSLDLVFIVSYIKILYNNVHMINGNIVYIVIQIKYMLQHKLLLLYDNEHFFLSYACKLFFFFDLLIWTCSIICEKEVLWQGATFTCFMNSEVYFLFVFAFPHLK